MKRIADSLLAYRERYGMKEFEIRGDYGKEKQAKFMLRFLTESFMDAFGAAFKNDERDHEFLRLRNLLEETLVGCQVRGENFPKFVDAMLGLAYTSLHTLAEFGIPMEEALDMMVRRHQSQGLGGFTREGKMLPRRFETSALVVRFVQKVRKKAAEKRKP